VAGPILEILGYKLDAETIAQAMKKKKERRKKN
jgi:hypothetical protein